jgi:AcrR family transcriptional regulator
MAAHEDGGSVGGGDEGCLAGMAHRLSSRRTARTRDQGERRRQLVAAAERAVLKHGSGGMRLRDVADEAGLTSGAVLYYYKELDDLLLETINRAIERFGRLREEAVDRIDDPRAKLIACLRGGLPSGPDDALVRLLYGVRGRRTAQPRLRRPQQRLPRPPPLSATSGGLLHEPGHLMLLNSPVR